MTCQTCLRLASRQLARLAIPVRSISTSPPKNSASAPSAQPTFSTPATSLQDAAAGQGETDGKLAPLNISSCPAGTVMTGLNYIKGKQDPVALPDEEYPDWLWTCLDRSSIGVTAAADEAGDEFSKSKQQRRLAAKKKRQEEARILASGDLSALAPKIPLAKQTINLPGDGNTIGGNVEALKSREKLRLAMRKERKIKIRENNYLRSM